MNIEMIEKPAPIVDRRKFIGGSDLAAILGISPWKTPLQLWNDKTQPAMPETDAARLRVLNRGKRMEPYILDMIRDEHGVNVIAANERYTDQAVDYFACEIDAEAKDEKRGHINIEIKTVHPFKVKEWGDIGTDALPLHYLAQVQWGLGITGRQYCDVYALIGDDLKRYAVEADGELIATLREKAIQFWVRYVSALTPPPPVSEEDLYMLYPADNGQAAPIDSDADALSALNELRALRIEAKELDARIEGCEKALKTRMGDVAMLTVGGTKVCTWKSKQAKRFDQKAFAAAHPALFEQFIKTSESRVFRLA